MTINMLVWFCEHGWVLRPYGQGFVELVGTKVNRAMNALLTVKSYKRMVLTPFSYR